MSGCRAPSSTTGFLPNRSASMPQPVAVAAMESWVMAFMMPSHAFGAPMPFAAVM